MNSVNDVLENLKRNYTKTNLAIFLSEIFNLALLIVMIWYWVTYSRNDLSALFISTIIFFVAFVTFATITRIKIDDANMIYISFYFGFCQVLSGLLLAVSIHTGFAVYIVFTSIVMAYSLIVSGFFTFYGKGLAVYF